MAEEAKTIEFSLEDIDPAFRAMFDVGVPYGRTKTKTHPRMKQYIAMNRNTVEILDVNAIQQSLNRASEFLKEKVRKGGVVLFVATQPAAQESVLKLINEFGLPGVISRWLGGTLTNFKVISKRIEHFKKLKADRAAGVFQKYTKKERLLIERDIKRLDEFFATLETFTALPSVIVMVDTNLHTTALREARLLKIPIVAFVNSDADPDLVDYPVFGNNKARGSIGWFLDAVGESIREGKKEATAALLNINKKEEVKNDEGSNSQAS